VQVLAPEIVTQMTTMSPAESVGVQVLAPEIVTWMMMMSLLFITIAYAVNVPGNESGRNHARANTGGVYFAQKNVDSSHGSCGSQSELDDEEAFWSAVVVAASTKGISLKLSGAAGAKGSTWALTTKDFQTTMADMSHSAVGPGSGEGSDSSISKVVESEVVLGKRTRWETRCTFYPPSLPCATVVLASLDACNQAPKEDFHGGIAPQRKAQEGARLPLR
jgi:hypothetical protein